MFVALAPALARADVIWPAAVLETRILTRWAIAVGLAVEWPAVRRITGASWARSFGMNVAMNLASTVVGIVLIPLLGIAWELFPMQMVFRFWNMGTFNPYTWGATVLLATLANVALEGAVLRYAFKIAFTRRAFALLFWANLISVGLAMASIVVSPPVL